jgi:hypothetical protein
MTLADDQKMIQAFTPHGSDETFGECVGPRRPHRRLDHPSEHRTTGHAGSSTPLRTSSGDQYSVD